MCCLDLTCLQTMAAEPGCLRAERGSFPSCDSAFSARKIGRDVDIVERAFRDFFPSIRSRCDGRRHVEGSMKGA